MPQNNIDLAKFPGIANTEILEGKIKDFENNLKNNDNPAAHQGHWSKVQQALVCGIDKYYGIKTSFKEDDFATFPITGHGYVRDASNALPLEQRLPMDKHPGILAHSMLLRSLARTRGIMHALEMRMAQYPQHADTYRKEIENLSKAMETLMENTHAKLRNITEDNIISAAKPKNVIGEKIISAYAFIEELQTLEKNHNNELVKTLITTSLDRGIKKNAIGYEALLNHYRNLASLLDPAAGIQTTIYDKKHHISHTITAHPITHKTQQQKEALEVMQWILPEEINTKKNFHHAQPLAIREANAAFSKLVTRDDRQLPAQTRKSIAPTLKNGFIVEHTLTNKKETVSWANTRAATLAYVGKGELKDNRNKYATDNLEQLRDNVAFLAKEKPQSIFTKLENADLNITILNTYTPQEGQIGMIDATYNAADEINKKPNSKRISIAYMPTNLQGTLHPAEVPPEIREQLKMTTLERPTLLDKSTRVLEAAEVSLFSIDKNTLTHITCASGQDRTGTLEETATRGKMFSAYQDIFGIKNISESDIEAINAVGLHNAMLATIASPGSPGMKTDSIPGDTFNKTVTEHMYTKVASTNKKSPIDPHTLKETLKSSKIDPILAKDVVQIQKNILDFLAKQPRWSLFNNTLLQEKRKALEGLYDRIHEAIKSNQSTNLKGIIEDWEKSGLDVHGMEVWALVKKHRFTFFKPKQTATEAFVEKLKEEAKLVTQKTLSLPNPTKTKPS